ncbi:hypothetical protein LTR08_005421 [Meristemomyces frigidus]|nr:hypothetical protein LTR08_005421 [Meristemomyces frigidus]
MSFLPLFLLAITSFLLLTLAVFALTSCVGDEFRAAWSGRARHALPPTTYGLQYARAMSNVGGPEGVEMEDMLDERLVGRDHDDDDDGDDD